MNRQNCREQFWTATGRTPRMVSAKTKGRAGWHQATPKTSNSNFNFTGLAARTKALIVILALWGWLPVSVADWLINRGELLDE